VETHSNADAAVVFFEFEVSQGREKLELDRATVTGSRVFGLLSWGDGMRRVVRLVDLDLFVPFISI
jgi:hypothetical protein